MILFSCRNKIYTMWFNSIQIDQLMNQMMTGFMIYAPKSRSSFESGNVSSSEDRNLISDEYTNMFIMPILITCIGALLTYVRMNGRTMLNEIIDWIFTTESKTAAKIEFEGSISKLPNRTKIEFDMGMGSVFYYIFKNFEKVRGLKHLKRIPDKNRDEFFESIYQMNELNQLRQEQSLNTKFFEEFFLTQFTPIHLPNGIQVVPETNKDDLTSDDSNEKTKKKMGKITNYNLTIIYDKEVDSDKNMNKLLSIYSKMKSEYLDYKRKDREDPKQYIYTFDSKEEDCVYFHRYPIEETKRFSHLFFEGKDEFVNEMNTFQDSKEEYHSRGKSYRKIILAYGEPGCGKTSLLMCLLDHMKCSKKLFKKQVIHLKLDQLNRKNLMDILFQETIHVSNLASGKIKIPFDRRIYVIEEIDGYEMTHCRSIKNNLPDNNKLKKIMKTNRTQISNTEDEEERENLKEISKILKETMLMNPKEKDTKLQIQDLLEGLDGIPSMQNGEIIFMTTNHIDKIDPALKREGRVNHLMEFKRYTPVQVEQYLEYYFKTPLNSENTQLLDEKYKTNSSVGWTPAYVESVCEISSTIHEVIEKLN